MRTGAKIVLSAVVALLGVASAVLGFIAEATRLKPDAIGVTRNGCVYPANPAFVLALCAAFLLGVAQIVASAAGGCCGCCRPGTTGVRAPKFMRLLGILAAILSWIAALTALAFYLQGAAWNVPVTRGTEGGGCYYLRSGVFRRAAVLSLVATALGIASYLMLTRARPAMTTTGAGYGYGPKPDGQYPPAVGMQQQYPAGHHHQGQGYGQGQPPYQPPAQGPYGQAPPDPRFAAAAPQGQGQGHAYANV